MIVRDDDLAPEPGQLNGLAFFGATLEETERRRRPIWESRSQRTEPPVETREGREVPEPMKAFEAWLPRRVAQDVKAAVWDCDNTREGLALTTKKRPGPVFLPPHALSAHVRKCTHPVWRAPRTAGRRRLARLTWLSAHGSQWISSARP